MLYADPETGVPISTHSMLKTFRRCPKQADYKYAQRLKPKRIGRPLRLGKWMHALVEADGKGQDWREVHHRLSLEWEKLFDEEKEDVGDLPRDCYRLMLSYLWHYKNDPWEILECELTLETTFPDGTIYRCRIDKLIRNEFGLWLVDHKWQRTFPDEDFRLLDAQSALYLWCALRNGIKVQGFIWDYARSKVPTTPTLIKSGARVSRWDTMDTDYPTAAKFFKEHPELNLRPYKRKLKVLRDQQYRHGEISSSTFFQRRVFEKSPDVLRRVAQENYHTSRRMHEYFPPAHPDAVERVVDRSCTFMCNYRDLCTTELMGGNPVYLRKNRFAVGDPMEYYQDDRQELMD
jgi:hypothetical protein